jgi:1,4-dihydroxy-2-naphthoate octaprenyltransferase
MLASIFLLGYVLAGGTGDERGALAFVILHVCLYGGATAFNSSYDRDEGPVGGLASPPPVTKGLLPFAWILQLLGLAAALSIGSGFAALYAAMLLLGIAYSHPSIRWKAHPWRSLLLVSFGQGLLGFGCGVFAARPDRAWLLDPAVWIGAASAALTTTALYPLTQIYQIDEDARRGDRTFAVAFGPRACFRLSLALLAVSAPLTVWVLLPRFGALTAAAVAVLAAVWLSIARWSRTYDAGDPVAAMRRVMLLGTSASGGFSLLLLGRLAGLL